MIKLFLLLLMTGILHGERIISRHRGSSYPPPPPYREKAETARYVVHYTDWAVLATISSIPSISGKPFTNVKSFCDGPIDNSTGIPFFFSFNGDASVKDIKENPHVSVGISEVMLDYCKENKWDPQDPRCARLTLTGKMVNVTESEKDFVLQSLFSRHPVMKSWAKVHDFFPLKLEIDMIWLIDYYGGASIIPVNDYLAVKNVTFIK